MTDSSTKEPKGPTPRKGRRAGLEGMELNPTSLVGSWFHRVTDGEVDWQGVIVSEPAPGVFLVEVDRSIKGIDVLQTLVPIREMIEGEHEWRFYDADHTMREAYAAWVAHERQGA